jgi:hypothetical protein
MRARTLTISTALAVAAGACGGDGVVALSDQPTATYVVRELDFPTNNTQARQFGIDLNGDGTVDNQFGMVMGALAGMGFGVQQSIDTSIAEGRTITLVRIAGAAEHGGFSALSELQVLFGTDPQPPACDPGETVTCTTTGTMPPLCTGCAHHLSGSASFSIDPSTPDDAPLIGVASDTAVDFGPGTFSLAFVNGDSPPVRFDLIGAHVRVALDGTGPILFAGALTMMQIDDQLGPLIQQEAMQIVERDCCGTPTSPGGATCNPSPTGSNANCGCIDGSQGKTIVGLFDANHDCMVTATEVLTNSLAQSLLAPDVTIDGQSCLSVGVQAFVVGASF